MNDNVYALSWDGANLYAGGLFTMAGGVASTISPNGTGQAWSALGAA